MTDPFIDRFSGISRLYGDSALNRFRNARVMIVGIGGVGSWTAESLVRSGIGHLILVDPDDVCVTNTNRQLHAVESTTGQAKTRALMGRLRQINPTVGITEVNEFYSDRTAEEILSEQPTVVFDAIDSLKAKCHLLATCRERQIPVITSGAAGGRRDATMVQTDDLALTRKDTLLAAVRKTLRNDFEFPKAPERGDPPPFGIEAVFSEERPLFPTCDGKVSHDRPEDLPTGLRCDAGYGSVTHVTATFGLAAAGRILEWISGNPEKEKGGH